MSDEYCEECGASVCCGEGLHQTIVNLRDQVRALTEQLKGSKNHYTVPEGGTLTVSPGTEIGLLSVKGGTVVMGRPEKEVTTLGSGWTTPNEKEK